MTMPPRLAAIPVLVLALLATGCASAPFVRGVKVYVPDVADELRDYANADTQTDTATRAEHLAAADALVDSTIDPVTLQRVKAAWERGRLPYSTYVDADADLAADEKRLRAKNIATMDGLIADEAQRWIYMGGEGG